MHILGLYINDCQLCDPRVLKIQDISQYDPDVSIEDPTIKIVIPGITDPVYPLFKIKGTSYFTSSNLGIDTECLSELPDGLWEFTYSVCPNDEVFVNYKYLRDCVTRNLVLDKLSKYLIESCGNDLLDCFGKDSTDKTLKDLKDLLLLLDLAKIDARNFNYVDAVDKLDYVNDRITDF